MLIERDVLIAEIVRIKHRYDTRGAKNSNQFTMQIMVPSKETFKYSFRFEIYSFPYFLDFAENNLDIFTGCLIKVYEPHFNLNWKITRTYCLT